MNYEKKKRKKADISSVLKKGRHWFNLQKRYIAVQFAKEVDTDSFYEKAKHNLSLQKGRHRFNLLGIYPLFLL